jgi:hypothetical protein
MALEKSILGPFDKLTQKGEISFKNKENMKQKHSCNNFGNNCKNS